MLRSSSRFELSVGAVVTLPLFSILLGGAAVSHGVSKNGIPEEVFFFSILPGNIDYDRRSRVCK